jgi:hypothetical protein
MGNSINPARELLGDGEFWLDRWTVGGAATKAYRFIGDVSLANAPVNPQTEETFEHTTGFRRRKNLWLTRVTADLELSACEATVENLALATQGDDTSPLTQSSATVTAEALPVASGGLDRAYQTAKRRISAITVKGGAAGTTALTPVTTPGTGDYIVQDAELGLIYFPSYSSFNPATDICKVDYTAAAITGTNTRRVLAGSSAMIYGTALFIPRPMSITPKLEVTFWKMAIYPNGGFPLIGDKAAEIKFKAALLPDGVHNELFQIVDRP